MVRADNVIRITGKVIKGPFKSTNSVGKVRCRYQIEIAPRENEKGQTFNPYIISRNYQAERDLERIRVGQLITVAGKLITTDKVNTRYLVQDGDGILRERNYEDLKDGEEFYVFEDVEPSVAVLAEDVMYFEDYLNNITEEERIKLFHPKMLEEMLQKINKN